MDKTKEIGSFDSTSTKEKRIEERHFSSSAIRFYHYLFSKYSLNRFWGEKLGEAFFQHIYALLQHLDQLVVGFDEFAEVRAFRMYAAVVP